MWGILGHFIAQTLSSGLPVPPLQMMFLKEPSGLLLLAFRAHLELPPYSQWDTNLWLSRWCVFFSNFSKTGMSGMEFDLRKYQMLVFIDVSYFIQMINE
jgi:hypothetical protein